MFQTIFQFIIGKAGHLINPLVEQAANTNFVDEIGQCVLHYSCGKQDEITVRYPPEQCRISALGGNLRLTDGRIIVT